jgi:PIN domain nuclease of toxin-antitoxin system
LSNALVLDTHVWIKFVRGEGLSRRARSAIDRAVDSERGAFIAAISLWEIALLSAEGRVKLGERTSRWFDAALRSIAGTVAAITPEIAIVAVGLGCHAEPADRLIMATALSHDAVLVTRDAAILEFAASKNGKELRVLEA